VPDLAVWDNWPRSRGPKTAPLESRAALRKECCGGGSSRPWAQGRQKKKKEGRSSGTADEGTIGKGRLGRRWTHSRGGGRGETHWEGGIFIRGEPARLTSLV